MNPSPHDEAQRWLAQAEADLKAAELLRSGGHFNLACFHAQQSAEKTVKGFLFAQAADEVWGHSVSDLLTDAATYDASLNQVAELGAVLAKFHVATRYPNGLPGGIPAQADIDQEARAAQEWAGAIIAEIRRRLT